MEWNRHHSIPCYVIREWNRNRFIPVGNEISYWNSSNSKSCQINEICFEACEWSVWMTLYTGKTGINRGNFFKIYTFRTKISSVESREFAWNKVENEENSSFIPYTSLRSGKSVMIFQYKMKSWMKWNEFFPYVVTLYETNV